MLKAFAAPQTLSEAIRYFSNPDTCLAFVVQLRWPNGVICPHCNAEGPSFLKTRRIWKCRKCRKQFSVKVGTIFEDSPLGLDKWLPALWMLANAKNGISSYEVSRALGVTQKTAWFMLGRIRLAMQTRTFSRLRGEVEVDESYIGGVAKFMHRSRRKRVVKGTGGMSKTAVMGLLQRKSKKGHSQIRGFVVRQDVTKEKLQEHIHAEVANGSKVYTDAMWSYRGLGETFMHHVVDHARAYAVGRVHTNGLENFWCLLKRAIKGTYTAVDPYHVFRYLDEQVFRFNNRGVKDGDRFRYVLSDIVGKRLTYKQLTGADMAATTT